MANSGKALADRQRDQLRRLNQREMEQVNRLGRDLGNGAAKAIQTIIDRDGHSSSAKQQFMRENESLLAQYGRDVRDSVTRSLPSVTQRGVRDGEDLIRSVSDGRPIGVVPEPPPRADTRILTAAAELARRNMAQMDRQIDRLFESQADRDEMRAMVQRVWRSARANGMTVVQNEHMHAYRTNQQRAYIANNELVRYWRWRSRLSVNTCPVCWAMHGTLHSLGELMQTHVSCQCVMLPVAVDIDPASFRDEPGADLFADLSAEHQRRILGPTKYAAYAAGRLSLEELVGRTRHPVYGSGRRVKTLAQLGLV